MNNSVQIKIDDYSGYQGDYFEGYKRLNSDIISGNIPDIILADGSFNMKEYQKKNMFCDLTEIIDTDIYKECVSSAFVSDDSKVIKLYPFLSNIKVLGIYDVSYFDNYKMNLRDFLKHADQNLTEHYSVSVWEEELLSIYFSEYVDIEKGKSDFNNEVFLKLIEFLKKKYLEEEMEFERVEPSIRFVDVYPLISSGEIESILLHGVSDEKEIVLLSGMGISVYANSKYKEEMSEFLNFMLSKNIQSSIGEYDYVFPVNKTELSRKINSMIPDFINISEEKISDIYSLFNRQMIINTRGSEVFNIVSNEIYKFYNEEITASDVANSIEKKINLYFSEI